MDQFKIAVVGNTMTGKSSWIERITTGKFLHSYQHSENMETRHRFETSAGNIVIKFIEYNHIPTFFKDTDAVVIFHDENDVQPPDHPNVVHVTSFSDIQGTDNHVLSVLAQKGETVWQISGLSNYNLEKPLLTVLRRHFDQNLTFC